MKLKIIKEQAIAILQQRMADIDSFGFDPKVWLDRTQLDVQQIFGDYCQQYFQIGRIRFDTFITSDKQKVFHEAKQTAKNLLKSYIDFINQTSSITAQAKVERESIYENAYNDLLKEWNDLVPEYNKLLKEYEDLHKSHDESLTQIKILEDKLLENLENLETYKILFLGASPVDEVRLRIDEEIRDIENGLRAATLRDRFELKQKWAITTKILQQSMLDEQPTIVHFSGHGDTTGIAVEDLLGNARLIDNEALGSLFELYTGTVQCVVLNSCYSETQAKEIAKYVPYVIGMKNSVSDKAALAFSVGFYTALGAGKDFKFAYRLGVVSIKLEGVAGSDIPVLIG